MSLKTTWQRICQNIEKSVRMNQENKEFQEENIENLQEQGAETTSAEETQTEERTKEEVLADELAEQKDRNLRLFAEFENYKKRTAKERVEYFKTANQGLLADLLPVLDDFARGMKQIENSGNQEAITGVQLIQNKLVNTLKNKGLEQMEINPGDEFDTEKHEAVTQIPAPTEDLVGKIVDVAETGYVLNEKVIRYAKVVVGK